MIDNPRNGHCRPNGRPVHPACRKGRDPQNRCNCNKLWDYWDGTAAQLDKRIAHADRLDHRRHPKVSIVPLDEAEAGLDIPSLETAGNTFFKQSEFLKSLKDK